MPGEEGTGGERGTGEKRLLISLEAIKLDDPGKSSLNQPPEDRGFNQPKTLESYSRHRESTEEWLDVLCASGVKFQGIESSFLRANITRI
jgi:hypothetical protein